jgi:hypothetical protein
MQPRAPIRNRIALIAGIAALAVAPIAAAKPEPDAPIFPRSGFQAGVDHPYFPLVPGTVWRYVEKHGMRVSENEVTVTRRTKKILGVTCIVVHDVERRDGKVVEDTEDWYAQDRRGNVWYFGEATREFLAGGRVSTEGSWVAGAGDAAAGIAMPANPTRWKPYYQEYSPGHAEDMAQVESVHEDVFVPAGRYRNCLLTKEWSPLERGSEKKWYARGVGLVRAESSSGAVTTLVSVTRE